MDVDGWAAEEGTFAILLCTAFKSAHFIIGLGAFRFKSYPIEYRTWNIGLQYYKKTGYGNGYSIETKS